MNPRISTILSVYNGEKYLKEALKSILDQTFKDFELIVINDGSTDQTGAVIDSFTDSRIIKIKNDRNLGLVASLNKGLEVARGEFIARMDADDISMPERFTKQVEFLEKNREVGVLGTFMRQVDVKGGFISLFQPPVAHREILIKMLTGTAIAHATVMIRKEIIDKAGGYDENFPHVEDTELWSRLIFKTKFANLPEALYVRRIHRNSVMSAHAKLQLEKSGEIRKELLEKVISKKILTEKEIQEIHSIQRKDNSLLKKTARMLLPAAVRHKYSKVLERAFFKNKQ